MASLNKIMIIGNLTRDPEVTFTQGGVAVCKISVATSESWTDKTSGEKREETEFHRVVFFGKQAEVIGKHFSKGKPIYVEGRNKTSKYTKDGSDRYSTDIIANNFQFIGSKQDNQQSAGQQGYQQPQNGGFQAPPQQSGGQQPMAGGYQNSNNSGFQNQGNQGFSSPPEDD